MNRITSLLYYTKSGFINENDFCFKYINFSNNDLEMSCKIKFSISSLSIEKELKEQEFPKLKQIFEYLDNYEFVKNNKTNSDDVIIYDQSSNYVEYTRGNETINIKIADKQFIQYMKNIIYKEILDIPEIKNILLAIKNTNQDKKYYILDMILENKL